MPHATTNPLIPRARTPPAPPARARASRQQSDNLTWDPGPEATRSRSRSRAGMRGWPASRCTLLASPTTRISAAARRWCAGPVLLRWIQRSQAHLRSCPHAAEPTGPVRRGRTAFVDHPAGPFEPSRHTCFLRRRLFLRRFRVSHQSCCHAVTRQGGGMSSHSFPKRVRGTWVCQRVLPSNNGGPRGGNRGRAAAHYARAAAARRAVVMARLRPSPPPRSRRKLTANTPKTQRKPAPNTPQR